LPQYDVFVRTENTGKEKEKHMATFYWVGGATSGYGSFTNPLGNFSGKTGTANMDWVLAFDWNNPRNWYEKVLQGSSGASGGGSGGVSGGGWAFVPATRSPSSSSNGQDIAVIGAYNDVYAPGYGLPTAKAPLLWGGASANHGGTATTWLGGSNNGTNGVMGVSYGGLTRVDIVTLGANGVVSSEPSPYPFYFIGGNQGFGNNALGFNDPVYSPLYDAQANGFTLDPNVWFGASWESLIAAVQATGGNKERLNQLRVQTREINSLVNDGNLPGVNPYLPLSRKNLGTIQLRTMKNYEFVSGSSGGSAAWYNSTMLYAYGAPEYRFSGYAKYALRSCPVSGELYNVTGSNPRAPRPHLGLFGFTAGTVSVEGKVGAVSTDDATNIAEMKVYPVSDYYWLDLKNKFIRSAVQTDLLSLPNSFGSYSLYVSGAYTTGLSGAQDGFVGVYLGNQGKIEGALVADVIDIGVNFSPNARRSRVKFAGSANINRLNVTNTTISGSLETGLGENTEVQIKNCTLYNGSLLDFTALENFDTWKFGEQVGDSIQGGIISGDDSGTQVKLSQGVVLFNDQIISGLAEGDGGVGSGTQRQGSNSSASTTSFT